jgi:hypothetical protein
MTNGPLSSMPGCSWGFAFIWSAEIHFRFGGAFLFETKGMFAPRESGDESPQSKC